MKASQIEEVFANKLLADVARIKNADSKMLAVMKISSEILDIVYHQDEFTTSDLQGAIEAQVMNAYEAGRKSVQ